MLGLNGGLPLSKLSLPSLLFPRLYPLLTPLSPLTIF